MQSNSKNYKDFALKTVELLADYLAESQEGKTHVLKQKPAQQLGESLNLHHFIKNGGMNLEKMQSFLNIYFENSQHMHHPQYIGHQVSVPHIASGLADMIHGVVNNPMSIYEMGPAAGVIERTVVNWMLSKIGWFHWEEYTNFEHHPQNGGGILTHGGSLANMTAMLAARAAIAPDAWDNGTPDDLVVFAPEVSHYSIARAISMIGLGKKSIIPIAVNDLEVMQPAALLSALEKVKSEGKRVMCVTANACATATGLYDPIDEIGHLCEENNLWFHVDGAHGASALISEKEKHFLKGIKRADSIIWDTHKMLRTTTLCAAVLLKIPTCLSNAFQQKGSYIFHEKEQPGFDILPYQVECTKAGLGTKLFWVLAAEGEKGLSDFVESRYEITRQMHDLINEHPDFECPYFPESNILCFRYIHFNDEKQLALRNELTKKGDFYISSAEVNGVWYLRLTVINPLTNLGHIEKLLEEIIVQSTHIMQRSNS